MIFLLMVCCLGGELMVNWHVHIAWSIQRHLDYITGGKIVGLTPIVDTIIFSTTFILHNILYIPGFNFNLISVSQLAIKFDCSIRFTDQIYEIQDTHTMRMIGFAKMPHGLYVLKNPKGLGKHFVPNLISINFVLVNKVND